jgi:SAM-dependent methyltransferase
VACPLCSGEHRRILVEAPDRCPDGKGLRFAIVRCLECGLCYTNPRPTSRCIGLFYPQNYKPHQPSEDRARGKWSRRYPGLPHWLMHDQRASELDGTGRLLDFGCGNGRFLEQMKRFGWKVTGVDICDAVMQRLRRERGLDAHAGSLPHPDFPPRSFDVITMWHSLEHVHNPRQVLRAAHNLLIPGGRLVVAVPNIDSLPFEWFGSAWYGLDVPRHLIHFAPDTLRDMLQSCGFAADPPRMVRHSSWLRHSARNAANSAASFWLRLCRAKLPSRLLSCIHYLTRQSDCILATAVKH